MTRHSFDPLSFLFGAAFVVLGVAAWTSEIDLIDLDGAFVWPVILLVAGAALLLSIPRGGRDATTGADPDATSVDPAGAGPTTQEDLR